MSGGRFNYLDSQLKGEIFSYGSNKPTNVFEDKEISELVWDVLNLIHAFDWYESGDTGRDSYLKAKEEFKKKWLQGDKDQRMKRYIDEVIEDARHELYETCGIEV